MGGGGRAEKVGVGLGGKGREKAERWSFRARGVKGCGGGGGRRAERERARLGGKGREGVWTSGPRFMPLK